MQTAQRSGSKHEAILLFGLLHHRDGAGSPPVLKVILRPV